jgi:putative nucleotidyltransferase with HDIG domain
MARDTSRTGPRTGRAGLTRRDLVRRDARGKDRALDYLFRSPLTAWTVVIWTGFVLLCSVLAIWARQQPLVAVGRVMSQTALVRVPFPIEDKVATGQARARAEQQTPRVYVAATAELEKLRNSVENLPRALANAEKLAEVAEEVRREFPGLTEAGLSAIHANLAGSEITAVWRSRTEALIEGLLNTPLVKDDSFQRERLEGGSMQVELRPAEGATQLVGRESLISIKDEARLARAVSGLVKAAGFAEPVVPAIVSRLMTTPAPTYQFDEAATAERRKAAVAAVAPVQATAREGQVIFSRGDKLDAAALEMYRTELGVYAAKAERWRVWLRAISIVGAVTAIALAVAGYLLLFAPRVRRNPGRIGGIAGLMAGALALACVGTVANPGLLMLTAIAPTVFVAVILVIGYDQRVALALGTLQGVLVCIALDQPIGVYALMLTGVSFAVLQLAEIRDRRGIIRMGIYAGTALAIGTVMVGLLDRPIKAEVVQMTLMDAALAGAGGLGVGVLTLAMLPAIERAFDITTGMTLIELRDPKQPLLRMLQQRAPGTYNHSLNVASIAEGAADAIRADGLLTYVGSLYHDIGKMNKPEYFVENQSGGPNKHDKLSPAMSLLVIVGHVKDGMAMAQEYGLPRSIQHFIEAHHGTTLVEFFYNRARRQAEQNAGTQEAELPEEIEYRYPGPRPRTKEVAILMLADAVESATRTMTEPTPGRIDALVRAIANKRLMDGQFDECELTLRDLQTIVESISKSVASIYHGRVLYPSTASYAERPEKEEKRA